MLRGRLQVWSAPYMAVPTRGGHEIELTRISAQGIYVHPNAVVLTRHQKWWCGYRPPVESKAGGLGGSLWASKGLGSNRPLQVKVNPISLLSTHLRKERWVFRFAAVGYMSRWKDSIFLSFYIFFWGCWERHASGPVREALAGEVRDRAFQ